MSLSIYCHNLGKMSAKELRAEAVAKLRDWFERRKHRDRDPTQDLAWERTLCCRDEVERRAMRGEYGAEMTPTLMWEEIQREAEGVKT